MVSSLKYATELGLLTIVFNLLKLEIILSHVYYTGVILMVTRLPYI